VTREFIHQLKLADVKIRNSAGDTAFHVAARSTNPKAIVYMLNMFPPSSSGWDIDDVNDNGHADTSAADVGRDTDTSAVDEDNNQNGSDEDDKKATLLDNGATKSGCDVHDVNENRDADKPTLLDICAVNGNAEAVALLIQHGADLAKGVLYKIVDESVCYVYIHAHTIVIVITSGQSNLS